MRSSALPVLNISLTKSIDLSNEYNIYINNYGENIIEKLMNDINEFRK